MDCLYILWFTGYEGGGVQDGYFSVLLRIYLFIFSLLLTDKEEEWKKKKKCMDDSIIPLLPLFRAHHVPSHCFAMLGLDPYSPPTCAFLDLGAHRSFFPSALFRCPAVSL